MSHGSKSRKNRRRIPRPRYELICAVAERLSKLPTNFDLPNSEHVDQMSAQLHRAVDRLKFGQADEQDLLNLQDAVNVSLKLITPENFAEALFAAKAAEHALIQLDERKTATGRWVAKLAELDALEAFLPYHDAIVSHSAHVEIERACAAVREDLSDNAAHAAQEGKR